MQRTSLKYKAILVSFGILLCLVILELGLRLAGGIILFLREYRDADSFRKKGTYTIVCLGESTTARTVWGGEYSWPSQLSESLSLKDSGKRFVVINKGVEGIESSGVLLVLQESLDKYHPDMVIAMIGINDWAGTVAYEDSPSVRFRMFFNNLRLYKLSRLLYLHVAQKFRENIPAGLSRRVKCAPELSDKADLYAEQGHLYNSQNKYPQAEEMFKISLGLKADNAGAYDGLGVCYFGQGKYTQAEKMFRGSIRMDPDRPDTYKDLGNCYLEMNKYKEAAEALKKAVTLDPQDEGAFINLGCAYSNLGLLQESERVYNKAIESNPKSRRAYIALGWLYNRAGSYSKAEKSFKRAIEINPDDCEGFYSLAECYREWGKFSEAKEFAVKVIAMGCKKYLRELYYIVGASAYALRQYREAEEALNKSLELDPAFEPNYRMLGHCYIAEGKHKQLQELAQKIVKEKLRNDRLLGFVATTYMSQGKYREARDYYKKAEDFRSNYYNPSTRHNYQKIKDLLVQNGVRLVCMQYPLLSIEPLKKLFDSTQGIIFVSNEQVFKDSLKTHKYEELFIDNFGGEFGHATPTGNKLIAENVADVIIKEVFKR